MFVNKINKLFLFGLFLLLVGFSLLYVEFDLIELMESIPAFLNFIFVDFLPPNFSDVALYVKPFMNSIYFAVVSTVFSSSFALVFSLCMAHNTTPHPFVRLFVRSVITFFRNIPFLIWASLLVVIFGVGTLPGLIALIIFSTSFLSRFYAGSIEEVNCEALEALDACGASYFQKVKHAVLPQFLPSFYSWTLFNFEITIRASAILGLVGAGGLGTILKQTMDLFQYGKTSTVIIIFIVLIVVVEQVTKKIKKQIMMSTKRLSSYHIIFVFLFVLSFYQLDLSFSQFQAGINRLFTIVPQFFQWSFSDISELVNGMIISLIVAFLSIVLSIGIAIILAFLSARNTTPNYYVGIVVNFILMIIRAIPATIWVLLAVSSIGFGSVAGVLGLIFPTTSFLVKSFSSQIEEVGKEGVEALQAVGGTWWHIVFKGFVPILFTKFLATTFFRFEINVAESVIFGMVGVGGIGLFIQGYISFYDFSHLSVSILIVFTTMFVLEVTANHIRKRLS
ncbi:MAG TPA: phosphonate ABC transporter, permease protein PhnE [Bacillus bacterium]|nr:phosphonate ABC transporter, permease protein PhnE [Bacillus sp. (in: firmicutes)]